MLETLAKQLMAGSIVIAASVAFIGALLQVPKKPKDDLMGTSENPQSQKDPLIEKLLDIGSMDGNQAIARTAYEAAEAIQYWKDRAHERVGRDYHRRECIAAGILGLLAGVASASFLSIIMWKVML